MQTTTLKNIFRAFIPRQNNYNLTQMGVLRALNNEENNAYVRLTLAEYP